MSMTLKTTKNMCCGLSLVFKITTRRSTINVRKKSDLSRKNRTTGSPGHVRKISDQPRPGYQLPIIATLRWASCGPGTGPQDAQRRVAIIVTSPQGVVSLTFSAAENRWWDLGSPGGFMGRLHLTTGRPYGDKVVRLETEKSEQWLKKSCDFLHQLETPLITAAQLVCVPIKFDSFVYTSGHCRRWCSRMEVKIMAGSLFVHCKIAYFYSVTAGKSLIVSLPNFVTIGRTHFSISCKIFSWIRLTKLKIHAMEFCDFIKDSVSPSGLFVPCSLTVTSTWRPRLTAHCPIGEHH